MTLQKKIILSFMSLTLATLAVTIWLSQNPVASMFADNLARQGEAAATELASKGVSGTQIMKETSLLPLLNASKRQLGAALVSVLDPAGIILADTDVTEKGQPCLDADVLKMARSERPEVRVHTVRGERMMDIVAPIWILAGEDPEEIFLFKVQSNAAIRRRAGSVRFAIPLRRTQESQTKLILQLAGIALGVGCIAALFAAWLMRSILTPVRQLVQGTSRIAQGDYGMQVPSHAGDELGTLARSFNRMSQVLAETTVSKDFLGNILASMLDPLMVTDPDGLLRMMNPAALRILEYTEPELMGKPAHMLLDEKDAWPDPRTLAQKDPAEKQKAAEELHFVKKSGVRVPVLFSRSLLKVKEGEVTGMIGVAKDLTDLRRLQGALIQSEKLAGIGQFAAGVAHDINNPMTVILGFSQELLRHCSPEDPLLKPLQSIEREGLRCTTLVKNLLAFSRGTRGKPVIKMEDLNRVAEGAMVLVQTLARSRKIELAPLEQQTLPWVPVDTNQIQQVLINLCTNAMDAMPQGGKIVVRLANGGDHVSISVQDTGTGIPPEIREKMFEAFFTTKEVGKGTGLGLSIITEIVKAHQGKIEVQSEIGKGSIFTIHLPVAPSGVSRPPALAA